MGIFTKNARIEISHHKDWVCPLNIKLFIGGRIIEIVPFIFIRIINVKRSGRLAVIVYIIKYIPAWRRSG
jgi:hypothetical protein